MQSSSIRALILRAHLLEMFLSIAFFGDGVIYVAWALQFGRKVIGRRCVAGRRSDGVLFRDEIHFEI
jgi:hypothetical protein